MIPGDAEKGRKNRGYPVAPEFAEMLLAVPEVDRTGFIFNPKATRALKGNERASDTHAGRVVARFGKAANVVADKKEDKTTFASAHDLRRSFGLRWSRRVMPPVLQELMRHETIQTTMKYYVGQDAQSTAAELHRSMVQTGPVEDLGNFLGYPRPMCQKRTHDKSS
jgi:integrase